MVAIFVAEHYCSEPDQAAKIALDSIRGMAMVVALVIARGGKSGPQLPQFPMRENTPAQDTRRGIDSATTSWKLNDCNTVNSQNNQSPRGKRG